ncbi:MAG: T9SS type A sorting domain-containing protein, partial [Bacteroidota bacterium]
DSSMVVSFSGKKIQVSEGISGITDDNIVLIAQITTKGDIEFQFNITVKNEAGDDFSIVSQASIGDTIVSPFLSFPPDCGCTDPDFLEFDPSAPCEEEGACQTPIAFGCADPDACNFDPEANFNIPELCCYTIDNCNNLDWTLICPSLSTDDPKFQFDFKVYPNPTFNEAWVSVASGQSRNAKLLIHSIQGQLLAQQQVILNQGEQEFKLDLAELPQGTYIVRLNDGQFEQTSLLVKN